MKKLFACFCLMFLEVDHLQSQIAKRFDVLIHELFPDPSPTVGLPGSEFIELRNTSFTALNLRNWKISDGSSTATVNANYILQPDSVVVLCATSAVSSYLLFGPAIGVTGFPSLNNDKDIVILFSSEGKIVHSVSYETSWYQNAVKSDGGWTLEMIDAKNPCGGIDNWRASTARNGGSPSAHNSIAAVNPDTEPPQFSRTYSRDSLNIIAVFNEPVDSTRASIASNYGIDHGLSIIEAIPQPPLFREVNLRVDKPLLPHTIYDVQARNIIDCSGNEIGLFNFARAGASSVPVAREMILNEILFNPRPDGTDYVECLNTGNITIDISGLTLGNRNAMGEVVNISKVSETPFFIFPGDHIVVTADAQAVRRNHQVKHPDLLFQTNGMPSMPDDNGNLVLLNQYGDVLDEVAYTDKWHFALIKEEEGVALERIDARTISQSGENWSSAAADAGYGTPTLRNSQFRKSAILQGKVELSARTFSPDNNGMEDHCFVQYMFDAPNNVINVIIFDLQGNVVKTLARNITVSQQGVFKWDGLDDRNGRLPIGVYIVLTEVFNLAGERKFFKNTVTLAQVF